MNKLYFDYNAPTPLHLTIEVTGEYIVDNNHIVAFTEGVVCKFRGNGKVRIQSRKVPAFTDWLWPFRPVKSSNNDD